VIIMVDPDGVCPFCKLEWAECACEEPEAEPVRCVECGMPLLYCECDVKILEEEDAIAADQDAAAQREDEKHAWREREQREER
jgi:hypothetical protein